jgi:2-dehydropantoate 2-reductase
MRICIFGAGSVGGYRAARLARAGREVAVVARGPHLQAIRAKGLTLETPLETFTVHPPASDRAVDLGPQDLVIVTAKTPALPTVARSLAPLLGPDTVVAFAVNGVFWFYGHRFAPQGRPLDTSRLDPDGVLHRLIGPERALGIVIYSPNEVLEPGFVQNTRRDDNRFVVGEPATAEAPSARVRAIARALDGCGFISEAAADIRLEMWKKLSRNVSGSPLCALLGTDIKTAFADPEVRELSARLLLEALAVAASHGFADLGIDPTSQLASRTAALPHKPSLLQDLERGRPMEVDSMLGIVRDFARQAEIATPTLDTVLTLLVARARAAGCYPPLAA